MKVLQFLQILQGSWREGKIINIANIQMGLLTISDNGRVEALLNDRADIEKKGFIRANQIARNEGICLLSNPSSNVPSLWP